MPTQNYDAKSETNILGIPSAPGFKRILTVPNVEVCLETLWIQDIHTSNLQDQHLEIWPGIHSWGSVSYSMVLKNRSGSRSNEPIVVRHLSPSLIKVHFHSRQTTLFGCHTSHHLTKQAALSLRVVRSYHIQNTFQAYCARLELQGTATSVPNLPLSNDSRNDQLQFLQANATKVGP